MPIQSFAADVDFGSSSASVTASWSAGDVIVVASGIGDNSENLNTPTATGLTFTPRSVLDDTGGGESAIGIWTATAGTAGSGVTVTATATGGFVIGMGCWVASSIDTIAAITPNNLESNFSELVAAGDIVIVALSDINATDPPAARSPSTGSGTATERIDAVLDSDNYMWAADWEGTAAGTFSFGPTNYTNLQVSQAGIILTPSSGPAPPATIADLAAAHGDTVADLTWSAPSANPAITSYDVEFRVVAGSWGAAPGGTDISPTTSFTVTGLTNGTTYEFRVRATNTEGDAAWSNTPTATPAESSNASINIQRGTAVVSADGETTALSAAVASLDNAFLVVTGNRHVGAGSNLGANHEGDDLSVAGYLSDTSTITWDRPATTPGIATTVYWEVWEYVGPSGGPNEFIVRSRDELVYTSAASASATLTNTPTDIDRCVPFINGAVTSDTANGANGMAIAAYCSGTDTLNVECGETDAAVKSTRVVTVEFTGSNWEIGHGRATAQTADTGTISLVTGADGITGSAFDVTDWATAAIVSWGHKGDGTNEAIADNWPTYEPGAGTATVDWTFNANHDGTDDDHVVHVLRHPDLAVTRYNNTSSTQGATSVDVTSAGLTDLAQASVLGTSISSGNGTAYARGWRNYRLTSLTAAEHWCSRSGNTMAHRLQVIDWTSLVDAATAWTVEAYDGASLQTMTVEAYDGAGLQPMDVTATP